MSAPRVHLPALTREEIGYRNAIAQAPRAMRFALGEGEWSLTLEGAAGPSPGDSMRLVVDWGGARFHVDVPGDAGARFLRHLVPGADASELPDSLRLAALEAMRAEVERSLGAAGSRRPLRLDAIGRANGSAPAPHGYAFALTSAVSGETIAGQVWTDVSGLAFAAPMLKAAGRAGDDGAATAWLDALPMALRLEAGSTVLERREFAALEPGDLILLDECWLGAGGEMSIAVGAGLALRARLEGQTLTLTQPLGPVMAETPSTPPAGRDAAGAADRIPVRLTFDLGERSMTVAELRDLKPGYTFDLGRELRRAVSIRAQGQVIGEGELVEIDGTLGVAITSMGSSTPR